MTDVTSSLCLCDSRDVCLLGLESIVRDGKFVGHVRRADYAFYIDRPMAVG